LNTHEFRAIARGDCEGGWHIAVVHPAMCAETETETKFSKHYFFFFMIFTIGFTID